MKIKAFSKYLKKNVKKLSVMMLLIVLNQICYLFLPGLMSKLIDVGIKKNGVEKSSLVGFTAEEIVSIQTGYILKIGSVMLLVTLLSVVITILINRIMAKISSSISADLRKDLFHKVMNLPYSEVTKFSTSSLITRITNDVEHVKSFIIMTTQLIVPPVLLLGGVIMSVKTCPSLTWIIVVGGLVAGGIAFSCLKIVTSRSKLLQETHDEFNLTIKQQLDGIAVIRGFGNTEFEKKRFEKTNLKFADISFFVNKVTAIMSPLLSLCANLLTVFILWLSSVRVFEGSMNVGQVVAFMQYSLMVVGAFVMISLMVSSMPKLFVSIDRVCEILECEEKSSLNLKKFPSDFSGKLEFKNVSFNYSESGASVLKNLNFSMKYGEKVGVIGSVGSGKSTLLKLIFGLYDVSGGEILFGSENIKNFDKTSLSENISYVSQKGTLFSGSIESNLRLGNENCDLNELKEILKIVNLENFKVNDQVFQQGKNLSGGQRQRLIIARTVLKKSRIYIFDDVFSGLDLKTEAIVRKNVLEKLSDKLVILVSHRVGTIKNLDKIVVLDDGKIAGIGKHDELLKNCEVYKNMVKLQIGGESVDECE